MESDAQYLIVKDIPLQDGKHIIKNRVLNVLHGCYYLDGGLQSPAYQADFAALVEHEKKHGWNYLEPIKF